MKPVFPNTLLEQIRRFCSRAITFSELTWLYPNRCFSSALHSQKAPDLLLWEPASGWLSSFCIFVYHWMFYIFASVSLEYQDWFFCICSVFLRWPVDIFSLCLGITRSSWASLDAADAVKRQTSSKGFMQDNGLTQLFSYRFLSILGGSRSTRTIQDVWTWNHMPQIPEADFSELKSHVISAHYTGIDTTSLLCVFVCHFPSSLVHKNSAKWVWLSNLLRITSNF